VRALAGVLGRGWLVFSGGGDVVFVAQLQPTRWRS
jgi:hypothetical protein